MKKLILIALFIPLLFACKNEVKGTRLTGTADNLEDGFFILSGPGGATDSVFLKEDQTFDFLIGELTKPSTFYISAGNDFLSIMLMPNQKTEVYFDMSDFKNSVKFGGEGVDINNYLVEKDRNSKINPLGPDVFVLPFAEYKLWADNNLKKEKELLSSTLKNNESDQFWITEEANLLYGWAYNLDMYEQYHEHYAGVDIVELPEGYDEFRKELDFNRPDYLESAVYIEYIKREVARLAREKRGENREADRYLTNLQAAADLISDKKVLDHIRVNYLKGELTWVEISELENAITFLKENVRDQELMADFDSEYKEWVKLAAGQPGLNFSGEDLEDYEINFSDFRGKYVYVDVWATWCGPCRYEIPYMKKLEADYHDRNIVFVSYSIDEDKQAWLDFVPAEGLGGVQIIGEDGWLSEMPSYYKVMGVPTFMFFDPEGKIISVKMTRPSDDETRKTFDSYTDL